MGCGVVINGDHNRTYIYREREKGGVAYLLREQRAMEQAISMGRSSKWPTGSKEASSRKRTALDSSAGDLWALQNSV